MGFIGYILRKLEFHPGPIVLGMILGPIAEKGFVQSVMLVSSTGSIAKVFFTRPISFVLILLSVVSASWPFIAKWWRKKKEAAGEVTSSGQS